MNMFAEVSYAPSRALGTTQHAVDVCTLHCMPCQAEPLSASSSNGDEKQTMTSAEFRLGLEVDNNKGQTQSYIA